MKKLSFLILLGLASLAWAAESKYLTYDEFIRNVEAGNVKSVTLDNRSHIVGTLANGDATNEFECYGNHGSSNDPLLNRILKEHGVQATLKNSKESDFPPAMWGGFVLMLSPLVGLVLLVVIIMKLNQILDNQRNRSTSDVNPAP